MIKLENISMHYGPVKAVDRVSFNVKEGEILGLLGPNGAGKSTTLKILTTYIIPTSGRVTVGGIDTLKDPIAVRRLIGYLPETTPLWHDMLTCDYLEFIAKARGVTKANMKERIAWVVDACGLKSVYKKTIIELSHGYKQRVGIAQALIHDPEIVILDEPTTGLDPIQIIGIRDLVKSLSKKKTIIFSTHILQEVTALSDRVVIINEGNLIADGDIFELEKEAMGLKQSVLTVESQKESVEKGLKSIPAIKSFRFIEGEKGLVQYELSHEYDQPIWLDVDQLVKSNNWKLRSFNEKTVTFEDTFIKLTKRARQKQASERRVFV